MMKSSLDLRSCNTFHIQTFSYAEKYTLKQLRLGAKDGDLEQRGGTHTGRPATGEGRASSPHPPSPRRTSPPPSHCRHTQKGWNALRHTHTHITDWHGNAETHTDTHAHTHIHTHIHVHVNTHSHTVTQSNARRQARARTNTHPCAHTQTHTRPGHSRTVRMSSKV